MNRSSGVLMHVSSLPGDYSIGSFGKEAIEFIDFLAESGFSIWQVLPFCMTDECNSPYKSFSSFSGNPFFIDLPILYMEDLVTKEELESAKQASPYLCEFARLNEERIDLLYKASTRVSKKEREEIASFISNYPYLEKAAAFLALRAANNNLYTNKGSPVTDNRTSFIYFSVFFNC